MEYNPKYSLLEMVKKVIWVVFESSGESRVARTFFHWYSAFIVGHSTQNMTVGTLLTRLSTLEKWSWAGKFGNRHELEREIKNASTQILTEICLYLFGKVQSLA